MSPNSTNRLRLALTTNQVLAYSNGQFLNLPSARQFTEVLSIARGAIDTFAVSNVPVKQTTLLRRFGLDLPGVTFVIDNAWVRLFVCRWDEGLKTKTDFFRYAEIEFQRRFHLTTEQWQLVPDRLWPGGETVWCAYQKAQIEEIDEFSNVAGFRVQSLLPSIFAEIHAAEFEANSVPTLYISAGGPSRYVCWIESGRVRDLVYLSHGIDDRGLVDVFLERSKFASPKQVFVLRAQGTRSEVLKAVVIGETVSSKKGQIELAVIEGGGL